MKKVIYIFLGLSFFLLGNAKAQIYYQLFMDPNHFKEVTANNAMRIAQEILYQQLTTNTQNNLDTMNVRLATVIAAKAIVTNSLTQVNEALKDGLEVKYLATLIASIIKELGNLVSNAKDAPQYLPFAEGAANSIRYQVLQLGTDVISFISNSGQTNYMDYNSRDEILKKVVWRLQLIEGEAYGMSQAVLWAKTKGLWNSLNPFSLYISQDKTIIQDIIRNSSSINP